MKYQIVINDYVDGWRFGREFETLKEAIDYSITTLRGSEVKIVQVIDWKKELSKIMFSK